MDNSCEFNRYHEYQYMPGDTKKEYPFVVEPYHVDFSDVMTCSHGVKLCALTMNRRTCNSECKDSCSRYKKYLECAKPSTSLGWKMRFTEVKGVQIK